MIAVVDRGTLKDDLLFFQLAAIKEQGDQSPIAMSFLANPLRHAIEVF